MRNFLFLLTVLFIVFSSNNIYASENLCENIAKVDLGTALDIQLNSLKTIDNMFPMKIAGMTIDGGMGGGKDGGNSLNVSNNSISGGGAEQGICYCDLPPPLFLRVGVTLQFWEMQGTADTTSIPYCTPPLGMDINIGDAMSEVVGNVGEAVGPVLDKLISTLLGSINIGGTSVDIGTGGAEAGSEGIGGALQIGKRSSHAKDEQSTSLHVHFSGILNIVQIISEMLTSMCFSYSADAVPSFSEINPFWQKDTWSMIQNPESLLIALGNIVSNLACMGESVSLLFGKNLDFLFWCAGSWGNIYPLTINEMGNGNYLNAAALQVTRGLAIRAKSLQLLDNAGMHMYQGYCIPIPTIFLPKNDLRMFPIFPEVVEEKFQIGAPSEGWGANKDNPENAGVMTWAIYQLRDCCFL